ncbi:MAG TPA: LysE family transporter [Salinimicrobium sp.]|nr:LysE family transporter [Salinimicrobium sp.]
MEETKIFLITYFAALVGVIPPGLVNMTVAKTCIQRGKRSGMYVAVGATVVVFIQALIAILLAKYIFNNPYIHNILLRTGLVILVLMLIYFLIMAKRKAKQVEYSSDGFTKSFFKGTMISALNIFPIPFFCAVGTALNINGEVSYHIFHIATFVLAAGLGTFTSLYFYVISFLKIESKADYFARYSNYFMAALMLILIVFTLLRIYT